MWRSLYYREHYCTNCSKSLKTQNKLCTATVFSMNTIKTAMKLSLHCQDCEINFGYFVWQCESRIISTMTAGSVHRSKRWSALREKPVPFSNIVSVTINIEMFLIMSWVLSFQSAELFYMTYIKWMARVVLFIINHDYASSHYMVGHTTTQM